MIRRLWILIFLLLIKVFLNIYLCLKFDNGDVLELKGKVVNTAQNRSNCIVFIDKYYFKSEASCSFSQSDKIKVIGRYDRRLIDMIYGKIYLSDAVIDTDKNIANIDTTSINRKSYFVRIRENIANIYYRYLPNREAALVAGIVLGDKEGIKGSFYNEMVNSGTIHIAVASGYNLMLVGGTVMSILFWVMKRKMATAVSILFMVGYTLMAGAEPPVTRALIMASMVFIGQSMGRRQSSWWALLLTGWVMVMFDLSLIGSVSFQLSIMASIGLMIVEPWMKRRIDTLNSRLLYLFSEIGVTTTLATMITTTPVIWWHFGRFSATALISNTLILPMVPVLMILGVFMIPLGGVMSVPLYLVSHLMVMMIGFFGK